MTDDLQQARVEAAMMACVLSPEIPTGQRAHLVHLEGVLTIREQVDLEVVVEKVLAAADAVCCKHLKCPGGSLCCCRNDAMVTVEQIAEVIMRALVFTNENSKPWADGVAREVRALFGEGAGDES